MWIGYNPRMTIPPNSTDSREPVEPMSLETPATKLFALHEDFNALTEENQQLKARIAWFEKQLFGSKSEKRVVDNPLQADLLIPSTTNPTAPDKKITISYERGTAKKERTEDCVTDAGLRFNDEVPVKVIRITPPELQGDSAKDYEIIETKVSRKLGAATGKLRGTAI